METTAPYPRTSTKKVDVYDVLHIIEHIVNSLLQYLWQKAFKPILKPALNFLGSIIVFFIALIMELLPYVFTAVCILSAAFLLAYGLLS